MQIILDKKKRGEEAEKLKNIATTQSPTVSASWLNRIIISYLMLHRNV